jgi:hypothetical protein
VTEPVVHRRFRRRGGGWMTWLAVFLIIGAIAVVGDRVAAKAASNELESRIQSELVARNVAYSSLQVEVGGTPFLTQVAQGRYDSITIDMTDVRLPAELGRGATLPALHVVATGVNANAADLVGGTASVVADQVTGRAVVSYTTLSSLIDLSQYQLSAVTFSDENGALKATASATVAGVTLPFAATADVSIQGGQIAVKLRDAKAVGIAVPQVAKSFLDGLVAKALIARLPALPFGLALDGISVASDGLAISATAHNVPLVNGRPGS